MKSKYYCARQVLALGLLLFVWAKLAWASDHADPVFNKNPEQSLAGLFVFPWQAPTGEHQLVVILTFYPGLPPLLKAAGAPSETLPSTVHLDHLVGKRYQLHFDFTTPVSFADEQQRLRFGGTVNQPEKIHSDASLSYQLNADLSLYDLTTAGSFANLAKVEHTIGIFDDPFIFPKFFGTNAIAIISLLPQGALPANQQAFIVWAELRDGEKKIDHVGRSNRTMQPRLNFLNTLAPKHHIRAIAKRHNDPGLIDGILMKYLAPLFAIRDYDLFADVMIYNPAMPVGFPNGRQLTDDVAAITCQTGDCLLWELSFADVKRWQWPRKTTNDKAFLPTYPFLASPWVKQP